MKRASRLIVLPALVVMTLSCASDIVLKEEFSLKGSYTGRYIVLTNYGSVNEVKQEQNIAWKFTDITFEMDIDRTNPLPHCFCEVTGDYELKDRLTLTPVNSLPPGDFDGTSCTACNSSLDPMGTFGFELPADSIKLTYSSRDGDTLKQVLLKRSAN